MRSRFYSAGWQIVSPSTELLINYFWLHWIYLGFVWGVIIIAALTAWLRVLHVPSTAFCWTVWAILGQASGAYVGPTCWAVLFLAAAAAVLHERGVVADATAGAKAAGVSRLQELLALARQRRLEVARQGPIRVGRFGASSSACPAI